MSWSDSGGYPRPGIGDERGNDLAWVVLDDLATRGRLHGAVRDALYVNLEKHLRAGEWSVADSTTRAFIDCWPLGALADEAREQWSAGSHAAALVILARAADVIGMAVGWPSGSEGPWPIPDAHWHEVHPGPWRDPPVRDCNELAQVFADDLVEARGAWVSRVVHGPALALHVTGEASDPKAFALAMGEVRMEADAQENFDRFGHAGLLIEHAPSFESVLKAAPAGTAGEILVPVCDGIALPMLDEHSEGGGMHNVGWLLWDGPYRPRKVAPIAIHFLQALDGETPMATVQAQLDLTEQECEMVSTMLLQMGAVTAAP